MPIAKWRFHLYPATATVTHMKALSVLMPLLVALALAPGRAAEPTPYPDKPIHLLVGFPPGSQPDLVARILGQKLSDALAKPVLVDNVTGAAGNIAAERLAKAAPDGYTLGLLSQTHIVINPLLSRLPYDPLKDFAPISQVSVSPNVLVVNVSVPAQGVAELVALARARPGVLTFASSGSGTGTHIAAELFMSTAALDVRHIPYKGVVAALPDLVAGRVTMMFSPIPVVLPLVREGKLRALAVTSLGRSSALPQLPSIAESGYPGFEATNWYGLVAPTGTDAAIVRRLHLETVKALALADVRARFDALGIEAIGNTPDEFAAAIRLEIPKWAKVIKAAGIKPDR
jgi:tripartite-type tricarboxylate transporter receptor subunit TctC